MGFGISNSEGRYYFSLIVTWYSTGFCLNFWVSSYRVEFFDQFDTVPVRSHKDRAAAKKEDPYFGTSFEPSFVYKMLSKTRSDTFKVEGRQEDAEEFLSCLLNGLHDEMIEILKITDRETASSTADKTNVKPSSLDDEDWQVRTIHLLLNTLNK